MHTPPAGQEYAMGWVAVSRPWAGGILLKHDGANDTNLALARLLPERNFAVLVVTNCFDGQAQEACNNTVAASLQKYGILPVAPSK